MIETRLERVFSVLREHEVRYLLMGGQACVIYGAAEFSKDIDFVILADPPNLERVEAAMASLEAEIRLCSISDSQSISVAKLKDLQDCGSI